MQSKNFDLFTNSHENGLVEQNCLEWKSLNFTEGEEEERCFLNPKLQQRVRWAGYGSWGARCRSSHRVTASFCPNFKVVCWEISYRMMWSFAGKIGRVCETRGLAGKIRESLSEFRSTSTFPVRVLKSREQEEKGGKFDRRKNTIRARYKASGKSECVFYDWVLRIIWLQSDCSECFPNIQAGDLSVRGNRR